MAVHVRYNSWYISSPSSAKQQGALRKPRRQRQRQRRETEALMSRTIAVHVRYNSLYISLPSSAKQEREMTKFCVVWRVNPDG